MAGIVYGMATPCSCCGEAAETIQLRDHKEIQICSDCLDWLIQKREHQENAQSGSWLVSGFEPIFVVTDIPCATDHYAKMGFEISHHDEAYAFAHRDVGLTIHFTLANQAAPGNLYVHCADATEVAKAWRMAGLVVTGPVDEEYGKREGSHVDPDGNLIRFGSSIR